MLLNINNQVFKSSDIEKLELFDWGKESGGKQYGLNVCFETGYEQLTFNTKEEQKSFYDFYADVLEKEEAKKHTSGGFVCKYCGAPNKIE